MGSEASMTLITCAGDATANVRYCMSLILGSRHALREWADYLIADNLDHLNRKDDAFQELNQLAQSDSPENLIQQAAKSRLKVIDWEKRLKELL